MPTAALESVQPGAAALIVHHDLSLWGLFLCASPLVKVVMIGLVLASVWSWAIIFSKITQMRRLYGLAGQFEEAFWSGGSLEALYDRIGQRPVDPMSSVFSAAMLEWRRSVPKGPASKELRGALHQRVVCVMQVAVGREMDQLERHLGVLASIGSISPFVGLFGTVWGIMNSFQAIASAQNTSLTVVAPAIAEALLATALGLVAAIPAVIAYNKFSNDLRRYGNKLDSFSNEFGAIMARQLEEGY